MEEEKQRLLSSYDDDENQITGSPEEEVANAELSGLPDLRNIVYEVLGDTPPEFIFQIRPIKLEPEYEKRQVRHKDKRSVQRVDKGDVKLELVFHSETVFNMVKGVQLTVKNVLEKNVSNAKVIHHKETISTPTSMLVETNLNEHGKEYDIYALARTPVETKKRFQITVTVEYENEKHRITVSRTTPDFKIFGTNKPGKRVRGESGSLSPRKKSRSSSFDSNTSADSGANDSITSPLLSTDLSSNVLSPQSSASDRTFEVTNLVADHIQTKSMEIDGTFYGRQMSSPNGDIAYHFYLDNQDEKFEEGQVVGFIPSTKDPDRKQVITKLDFETASKAILKGVITRSQYIEAKCPEESDHRRTETICMMGIVPVQVIGSVSASEILYASPDHPGYAISGFHLDFEKKRDASMIGVAFASHKTDDETSIGFVDAGVSVMQFASQFLVNEKLRNIEEGFDDKIKVVKNSGRTWRRALCCCSLALALLVTLFAIYMWQLYTPGSAYHYYICERYRTSPHASVSYTPVFLKEPDEKYPKVYGIEYDFDQLKMFLDHPNYFRLKKDNIGLVVKEPRYFLNVDLCAHGKSNYQGVGSYGRRLYDEEGGSPGVDMFAVDGNCTLVFLFDEVYNRWRREDRVSRRKYGNIYCNPSVPSP